jgi:hypothetical protein
MAVSIDDERRKTGIKTKENSGQLPDYLLKAHICKIKADYLRIIYECLDGMNGLLSQDDRDDNNCLNVQIRKLWEERKKNDKVECDYCTGT